MGGSWILNLIKNNLVKYRAITAIAILFEEKRIEKLTIEIIF